MTVKGKIMGSDGERTYRFADYTLDVTEHRVKRRDQDIYLPPKTFEILLFLVERPGRLVKKDELLDALWPDAVVSENALTRCIKEVRKALGDDAQDPRFVQTVPRVGYKFIAKVEEVPLVAPVVQAVPLEKPSLAIAVVPFANLSAEPDNEYLCDGLAEELINALTKVKDLRVVAHSSAFSFKGRNVDVREIGRQLNVGSVLEGSVRKAGDRLRISAQLINVADGYHLWSEQYDRRPHDVLAIEDEISLAVLDKLKVTLLSGERSALAKRYTVSPEAYRLYLKGRTYWHRRETGFLPKALQCFEQTIEKDPLFALAYSGLADVYTTLGTWSPGGAPGDFFPTARALADKALEIDDGLAEAHASRAVVRIHHDWEWAEAERGCRRALELNPGYASARFFLASYLSYAARLDEAVAEIRQAQLLDPLSPLINANAGWILYLDRQYEASIDELRKTIELDPGFGIAYLFIGCPYIKLERYEEAIAAFQKAIEVTGGMRWAPEYIGYAYGLSGERDKARKVLEESLALKKQRYVPETALAIIYLGLGERGQVFEWLNRAYDERDALLPWINTMPDYDGLRSDPRFQALLRRLGLGREAPGAGRPSSPA